MNISKKVQAIADALGITGPQAYRALHKGLIKLTKRHDRSLVINTLYGMVSNNNYYLDDDYHPLLQPGSVECCHEWIKLYGGVD
jgi:hypothetical protein